MFTFSPRSHRMIHLDCQTEQNGIIKHGQWRWLMLHSYKNKQVATMRQIWLPVCITLQRNKERVASFTIAPSISHCRAIASSWSRYRTVVSSSPHYRAITLSTSIQSSKVRWYNRKIHDPIRIPYIKNTHFTPILQGRKN